MVAGHRARRARRWRGTTGWSATALLVIVATAAPLEAPGAIEKTPGADGARTSANEAKGGAPHIFALAVGANRSPDRSTEPLRYADDDAVQNAMLMRDLGASVILLAEVDADTAALHPDLEAPAPTGAALRHAWQALEERVAAARLAGHRTSLYLFYSGHGGVDRAEGYVALSDGRLWRRDLIELLSASTADEIHLVVDACQSYFLVFARGAGGERRRVIPFATADDAPLPPNVGTFLSTSSAADSHEWEAYQAGVFSHEMRSALRGGADVNGDAVVSYQEAAAFIWNANAAIPNARFRPRFFVRAPGASPSLEGALVDLERATGDALSLGPGVTHPLYLEDARGIRLGDLHPAPEVTLTMILPQRRPLFVRRRAPDREIVLAARGPARLVEQRWRRPTARPRGAEHVAFSTLFQRPFSAASVTRYLEEGRLDESAVTAPDAERVDPLLASAGVVGAGGLALLAAGGTMTVLAAQLRLGIDDDQSAVAVASVNQRIAQLNTVAVASYGAAALLAVGFGGYALLTRWLPEPSPNDKVLFLDQPVGEL